MKLFSTILGALLATSLLSVPAAAATREETTLDQSLEVLRDLQAISDTRIPDLLLSKAEGIVILPANVKVGLWFGASFGKGVMLVRNPDRSWSNPVYVKTGGGSWGAQFGGQVSDIVLVLTTRESIEGITDGKMTMGAGASVAAGPVGRSCIGSYQPEPRFRNLRVFEDTGPVRGHFTRRERNPHRQEGEQAVLQRRGQRFRDSGKQGGPARAGAGAGGGSGKNHGWRGRERCG